MSKVTHNQKGYAGSSMSVRAEAAYQDGLRPLSKIPASELREAGIEEPVKFIRHLAKTGRINADEWHHTSKFANSTDFWSIEHLREEIEDLAGSIDTLRATWNRHNGGRCIIEHGVADEEGRITEIEVEVTGGRDRDGDFYIFDSGDTIRAGFARWIRDI